MSERVLTGDVVKYAGSDVTIRGWLHKKRLLGGLNFILVRDRSGVVQVVLQDEAEVEKLRGLHIGTVLKITGQAVEEERAPGGAEIHEPKVTVEVPVTDEPPIEIDTSLACAI
jgi:nondiscriminating aspartyl-tRNA synthetase